jgi:hypothetical protein
MTSKEFRIWVEGFLTNLDLDNINIRDGISPTYNHLTMLKTINNKLKEVNDVDDRFSNTLLTERFTQVPTPNPFEIKCESKKK